DEDSSHSPNQTADQRHRAGLNQELAEHIASLGAKRLADADLARPPRHWTQHRVHDYDAANDQRNRSNGHRNNEEVLADARPQTDESIVGINLEAVRRGWGIVTTCAQDHAHLVHGIGHGNANIESFAPYPDAVVVR